MSDDAYNEWSHKDFLEFRNQIIYICSIRGFPDGYKNVIMNNAEEKITVQFG